MADGPGLVAASSGAVRPLGALFIAIAVPILAYVLMPFYYLTLDVISAIVSLPGKLDLIAERTNDTGQP